MKTNLAYAAYDTDSGPLEPDGVLPSQFFDLGVEGPLAAEKRLMAALLSDGIELFLAELRNGARGVGRDWVERSDPSYVFGFESVCDVLGINAGYLRRGLLRYAENTAAVQGWKKIRRPRK